MTPNAECRMPNAERGKAVWGGRIRLAIALMFAAALLALTSCSEAIRTGQGSSYLILTNLVGAAGSNIVLSDVRNVDPVTGVQTVRDDTATATLTLAMKDVTLAPTINNAITITQYHVKYVRSDGHNIEGVDVPFAFDGAVTVTVSGTASVTFTLVRNQAKLEAPLAALANVNVPLTTIAEVTFFGHDQTGRDASVSGSIEITFANFPG